MKKLLISLFVTLVGCSSALATDDVTAIPQKLKGIGQVERYRIANNVFVGVNFNVELLFIATATGSNFTHKGYVVNTSEPLGAAIRDFFSPFVNSEPASQLAALSAKVTTNKQRKFGSTVESVMAYDPFLKRCKKYRLIHPPKEQVIKTLREFSRQAGGKRFFKQNLAAYNKQTENYIRQYSFNHIQRLQEFFGVTMERDQFEIILSPVMAGGQAFKLENTDHSIKYIIIINPNTGSENVLNLIYHETAHNFLSPVLDDNRSLIKKYAQYANLLGSDSIGQPDFFSSVNETLARLVTLSMLEKYHGKKMAYQKLDQELSKGWRNLDELYFLTKNKYLAKRDQYPDYGKFLPVVLDYLEAKGKGKPLDPGPVEEIKRGVIIGNKEGCSRVGKFIPWINRGMDEASVAKLDEKWFDKSLVVVAYSPEQQKAFTGKYESVIGYNYQEMLNGLVQEGSFTKVYQNGARTTLVFAAQDMAALEQLMARFDFKPYL